MTESRIEHIGDATLYLGDCREILPTLGKVDAIVTDPPYGVAFKGKETKHTLATQGYIGGDSDIGPDIIGTALCMAERAVVFPGTRLLFDYPRPYEIGTVYCPSGAGLGRWGFTVHQPILFYGMGLPHTRRTPNGFESFDAVEDNGHPCPKPVRWMLWAINKCSVEGQIILDPFMGSGTTGVAAIRLRREFIGIEVESKYFDIACRRIEAETHAPRFDLKHRQPFVQEAFL